MGADEQVFGGLLETYEVAIAELEEWDDPATGMLLASLKALRQRALGDLDEVSAHALALD